MSVCARCVFAVLVLVLGAVRADPDANVTVVWQQLAFEETHELIVNASVEFILPFVPNSNQGIWPVRVWIKVDGGDTARPLLVTARRRIGATTWQLPYRSGDALLYELERTLCPEDSVEVNTTRDDCDDSSMSVPGQFSLHIGSSCAASTTVQLRASFVRDWRLPFESTTNVETRQGAPRVHSYQFLPGQNNVRLVIESEDDVCAIIAVQYYTCPIVETLEEIEMNTLRMTVLRSGGMQLQRSRFPRGFYVVAVVHDTDSACREDDAPDDDWLWEAAVLASQRDQEEPAPPRVKRLTIHVRAALSRKQYLVGSSVTLVFFTLFYITFGALVLAQRLPRWKKLVGPRAVLAHKPDDSTRLEVESVMSMSQPRRRRDSTATFDSSDNSDTDDEEEEETATATTVATSRGVLDTVTNNNFADSENNVALNNNGRDSTTNRRDSTNNRRDSTNNRRDSTNNRRDSANNRRDSTNNRRDSTNNRRDSFHIGRDSFNNGRNSSNNGRDNTNVVPAGDINTAPESDIQRMPEDSASPSSNGIYVIDANVDQVIPTPGSGPSRESWRTRPFGLPARLHVAALARRRTRVLVARSDRYLYTLYTVGLFYALPVVQFVAAFQILLNVTGSLDACYYNFLCAHPAGAIADFNHVFSNVGYLLLGALFMLQVRRRKMRRKRKPRDEEYGIPSHYGLLSSLGAAMMMVALLSATYHICPNGLNFQFDTAFMYVLAVLSMIKIYQSRHPDINARAHATFGVLAVLIALVVWGVLGGGPLFWSLFTVLHVFTFLLLSLRIYYVGQFRLEKESLAVAARGLAALPLSGLRPLYTARLVMLLIANAVNWGFALYGLFTQGGDFASHLLSVLLCNTLLYMVFYLTMKLLHGERPRWYAWVYLAAATASWAPALYFFTAGSTNWSSTPALSRQLNHECRVLQFYDSHDLWHFLSAIALYFSFNAMLTWDDGLAAVKRNEIAVF